MKKKKYDTSVVMLYLLGREKELPFSLRRKIPHSTIHSWRRTDYSSYVGYEYKALFEESFGAAQYKFAYERQKRLLFSIARAWVQLKPHIPLLYKAAKKNASLQKDLLRAINHIQREIGLPQSLRLTGISKVVYSKWVDSGKNRYTSSKTNTCVKRYPHQLSERETNRMKKLLQHPDYEHWPIVSIAGLALRNKSVVASLYTWYKYAKLFGVQKEETRKPVKTVGLIPSYPNEYLHADTTYYQLNSESKVCITFVMDSYSKLILGYAVAKKVSFALVKEAIQRALVTVRQHPDQRDAILMTDGGRENDNRQLDEFLASLTSPALHKITALKDIRFSNNPVEASHRIIKGRYLRNKNFQSLEALNAFLESAVKDYNNLRPHYKFYPKTPEEVYFGTQLTFDLQVRLRISKENRAKNNRRKACQACTLKSVFRPLSTLNILSNYPSPRPNDHLVK